MKSYAAFLTAFVAAVLAGATTSLAVQIEVPNVPDSMLGHHPDWADVPDLHFYCETIANNSNDRVNVTLSHKDAAVYVNGVKSGILTLSNAFYNRTQDAFGKYTITVISVDITEGNDWIFAAADNAGRWYYSKKNPLTAIYQCLTPSL